MGCVFSLGRPLRPERAATLTWAGPPGDRRVILMIRRITRIDDSGLFKSWRPDSNIPEFTRINLIYGSNGSGKSTLARLLQTAAVTKAGPVGIELTVDDAHGGTRQVTAGDDSFWPLVRVFNKEYVDRTLWFDRDGKSDAAPLLVLGEEQIDREAQVKGIEDRLEATNNELVTLEPACARSEAALKKLSADTARQIVEELQIVGGRYEGRRYNAAQVQQALAPERVVFEHKSTDVPGDLQLVQGRRLGDLELPAAREFALDAVEATVRSLLAQTVTSRVMEELRDDPNGAAWVQHGLDLHQHRDHCLFCGGAITPERRHQIEQHFDESVRALQREIAATDGTIDRLSQSARSLLDSLPNTELLYDELREVFIEAKLILEHEVAAYQGRLAALSNALQEKRESIFSARDLAELSGPSDLGAHPVVAILQTHNKRSADFKRTVDEAAKRIELTRLANIADDYDRLNLEIRESQKTIGDLKEERAGLQREHARLNSQRLDPGPLADELTRDVAALLGRNELSFQLRDGRYVIERNGSPALGLSEGEKTAISLLYFLCSLREEPIRDQEAVVVIDDPVSSLDHEVLVGASGHIWSALVANNSKHQVFLLTHSFELFRMWSNQLDRLPGRVAKESPNLIAELRVRWRADSRGNARRRPTLIPWTDEKQRKALRSQYHYLFWRVGTTVLEGHQTPDLLAEVEATAIIPNAARKMLEAFLAFRYPGSIGDFEASMRRALEFVSEPTKQRVTRFLHNHSHNEDADLSRSVQSGEALSVLMSVFELIKEVDQKHYDEMCSSLGLDGSALGSPSTSAAL
jgi:wobble nucleotide-excising tRNase